MPGLKPKKTPSGKSHAPSADSASMRRGLKSRRRPREPLRVRAATRVRQDGAWGRPAENEGQSVKPATKWGGEDDFDNGN